ncbi:MAG: 4Fe-4S dicluster domain-containing protein, partial [Candidatus Hydrothermarchaeaceae archaeon]
MKEEPRIGVYVCHCGLNIAGVLDVKELAEYASKQPSVVMAKDYMYMCSSLGQDTIIEDIKEHNLNRVLIAACTPKLHESTFMDTLEAGKLNPYLLEQANIREHVSWVHANEREKAQKKAKDLLRMGLAKARLLEPLEKKEMAIERNAVVIGGGIAGMRSSLDLAKRGFEVHLIEGSPTIGGGAALMNRFDTEVDAAPHVMDLIDAVTAEPNINLRTLTEVTSMSGFIGNFDLGLKTMPRYVREGCNACMKCVEVCPEEASNEYDYGLSKRKAIYLPFDFAHPKMPVIDMQICTKCGKCIEVCPEGVIDLNEGEREGEFKAGTLVVATGTKPYESKEGEFGYGESPRVVTLQQLERMLSERSPSSPEIEGKTPGNVVFIGCVGSRQKRTNGEKVNEYCSRVCCTESLKNGLLLKDKYPDVDVFFLFRDIRTYGRYEYVYRGALDQGIIFIQYPDDEPPKVNASNGCDITVHDVLSKRDIKIKADLVVLATGVESSETAEDLQKALKIQRTGDGFFQEAHIKLRPLETSTSGIFLAGACQGPKNVQETLASASAAAAKSAIPLSKGMVVIDPMKAMVTDSCDGCAICIEPCIG